jgi:hypothetical protein
MPWLTLNASNEANTDKGIGRSYAIFFMFWWAIASQGTLAAAVPGLR